MELSSPLLPLPRLKRKTASESCKRAVLAYTCPDYRFVPLRQWQGRSRVKNPGRGGSYIAEVKAVSTADKVVAEVAPTHDGRGHCRG